MGTALADFPDCKFICIHAAQTEDIASLIFFYLQQLCDLHAFILFILAQQIVIFVHVFACQLCFCHMRCNEMISDEMTGHAFFECRGITGEKKGTAKINDMLCHLNVHQIIFFGGGGYTYFIPTLQ